MDSLMHQYIYIYVSIKQPCTIWTNTYPRIHQNRSYNHKIQRKDADIQETQFDWNRFSVFQVDHRYHWPMLCYALWWRHNGRDSVPNHQPHDCLPNRLFRRRSKNTSKLRVTGLCVRNSPGTVEFPSQMASYAENVSIWWRHHGCNIRIEVLSITVWIICWKKSLGY